MTDTANADLVAVNDEAVLLRSWLLGDDPEKQVGAAAILCQLLNHLMIQKPEFVLELYARWRGNGKPAPIVPGKTTLAFWNVCKNIIQDPETKSVHVAQAVLQLLRVFRTHWSVGYDCLEGDAPRVEEVAPVILEAADRNLGDFSSYVVILLGMYGPDAKPYLDELLKRLSEHRRDCMRAPGLTWAVLQIAPAHAKVLSLIREMDADPHTCPHSREIIDVFLRANELKD